MIAILRSAGRWSTLGHPIAPAKLPSPTVPVVVATAHCAAAIILVAQRGAAMETPELAMEGIELALRGAVGEPAFTDAMENALIEAHTVSAQGRSSKSRQRRHSTAEDVPSEPKCDEGALRSQMERLNAKARTHAHE
jgi:hypothetical protein